MSRSKEKLYSCLCNSILSDEELVRLLKHDPCAPNGNGIAVSAGVPKSPGRTPFIGIRLDSEPQLNTGCLTCFQRTTVEYCIFTTKFSTNIKISDRLECLLTPERPQSPFECDTFRDYWDISCYCNDITVHSFRFKRRIDAGSDLDMNPLANDSDVFVTRIRALLIWIPSSCCDNEPYTCEDTCDG
jgi:hypothetical protein